jgi:hypothetical protein
MPFLFDTDDTDNVDDNETPQNGVPASAATISLRSDSDPTLVTRHRIVFNTPNSASGLSNQVTPSAEQMQGLIAIATRRIEASLGRVVEVLSSNEGQHLGEQMAQISSMLREQRGGLREERSIQHQVDQAQPVADESARDAESVRDEGVGDGSSGNSGNSGNAEQSQGAQ